jgi:hypothetical protein
MKTQKEKEIAEVMRVTTFITGGGGDTVLQAVPAFPSGKSWSGTRYVVKCWEVKKVKWCEFDCFGQATEKITISKIENNVYNI